MVNEKLDPIEEEIHAIRLALYEETKGMTPEEEIAYLKARSAPFYRKFNITISDLKPVKPLKREGPKPDYSEKWWREQFGELCGIA